MKTIVNISRFIVGVLFIFSGLVKANDPLGLSYKMQEFFEVWGMHSFNNSTLAFSIIIITFEILAGFAVLLGWKMRLFSWLLLLLIIFFTFLTGYALFSGKIRECGCFGDCIPLQAHESFIKDLILLVLILVIFPYRNQMKPLFSRTFAKVVLFFSLVLTFAFQWYVLQHLPVVDCLPYKVGNNIPEKMKIPPGAIPDSTVIMFTYEKNGKQSSFTAENFPADFDDSYKFIKREDKVVRKGTAVPAIRDFALQTNYGNDTTQALLTEPGKKLFLFLKDGYKPGDWIDRMDMIIAETSKKNMKGFLVSNLEIENNRKGFFPELTPLKTDGTAIKTAARYNPVLFLVDGGTIVEKWSAVDFDQALRYLSATN
ncbi:MAG: DoxX family protein [Chitinophagaceae bacterium]|nr:DoxX family protein [Chitinophagaceae bacterium]